MQQQELDEQQRQLEERKLQDEKAAAELGRIVEEARRKEEEAVEKDEKARAWLRKNGFKHVNELVRKKLSKVRPLHVAVRMGDAEVVRMLLGIGADRSLVRGKNETPLQLAHRMDTGSVLTAAVIRALSEGPTAQRRWEEAHRKQSPSPAA